MTAEEIELKETYRKLLLALKVMTYIVIMIGISWIITKALKHEDPKASMHKPICSESLVFNK